MRVHMTNIYNMGGAALQSQKKTYEIAKQLGINELGVFYYDYGDEPENELNSRLDGVLASVWHNDIVFIQSPIWNGVRWERTLISKLRRYVNIRIVMYIHDVVPLLFNTEEEKLREVIDNYNQADLVIVSSQEMWELLCRYGLKVKKYLVQQIWDFPVSIELEKPTFYKRLFFLGEPSRFDFVNNWDKPTPIVQYSRRPVENGNVIMRGFKNENELLIDMSKGGYGLVWTSGGKNFTGTPYYKLLQPYKLANYLAAGIPVIMEKGLAPEEVVLKNGLGFVAKDLEEVNDIVQNTSEEQYNDIVRRIADFNMLIKNGWFTKKILSDAIMMLLNE